ncbi:MAG: hypothetical protein ACOYLL_07200 [Beijerinckiaceae bacterium]
MMDPAPAQSATTIPVKGIGTADVITGVLAGLICGVFGVFLLAWTQGGVAEFDLESLLDSALAVMRQIYPL